MTKRLILLFLLLQTGIAAAQDLLDFDSLYRSDKKFKRQFKQARDTIDIYNYDRILNVRMEADFKDLTRNKNINDYRDAILKQQINDTVLITRNLKIKPRGALRRRICHFPPLKMNLPKKEVFVKSLKDFDKIKMVGSCRKSKTYEQYIIAEFLVYKLFNIITDYSFRVRMLNVEYVDTGGRYKSDTRHAFIIEPITEVADRLNSLAIEVKGIHPDRTQYEQANIVDVFQFMIGNTDYSVAGLHNIKMIKSKDFTVTEPTVIPYDFDYSGIINATYAVPAEVLGIKDVTERKFVGFCRTEAEFKKTFQLFNDKRDQIYELYESHPLLTKKFRNKSIKYLDQFYEIINNDKTIRSKFLYACRKD